MSRRLRTVNRRRKRHTPKAPAVLMIMPSASEEELAAFKAHLKRSIAACYGARSHPWIIPT